MDTDSLSQMAYHTIRLGRAAHDMLKTEIGASTMDYDSEDAFLEGTLEYVISLIENPSDYLEDWDLIDEVGLEEFKVGLEALKKHLVLTLNTPMRDRGVNSC